VPRIAVSSSERKVTKVRLPSRIASLNPWTRLAVVSLVLTVDNILVSCSCEGAIDGAETVDRADIV
jgi:hypothetical protein